MSRGSSSENGGPGSSFSRCFLSYGDGKIEIHASSKSKQENSSPWSIVCRNFRVGDPEKRYVYSRVGLDVFGLPLLYLSWFSFRVYHVMHKYLSERNEVTFDKIFDQRLGGYNIVTYCFWNTKRPSFAVVTIRFLHNITLTWRLYFKAKVIHSVRFEDVHDLFVDISYRLSTV